MKKKSAIILVLLTLLMMIEGVANAQEYVDLGLPSGTRWADRNVGARGTLYYGEKYRLGAPELTNYDIPTREMFEELSKYCTVSQQTGPIDNNGSTALFFLIFTGRNGNSIRFPLDDGSDCMTEFLTDNRDNAYYCFSLGCGTFNGIADHGRILNLTVNTTCYVRPVRVVKKEKKDSYSGNHQYVDLGLSSGTLWATTNLGADNPWDYGDYFAWGETSTKYDYSSLTYKYDGNGRTTLESSDDAATANWGSDWCMPTQAQFQELIDECLWMKTIHENKWVYEVIGPSGSSIFFPATRYISGTLPVNSIRYWSSEDYYLVIDDKYNVMCEKTASFMDGLPVRPVRRIKNDGQSQTQPTTTQPSTTTEAHAYVDLGLPSGTKWATCNVGAKNPEDYGNYFAWGETGTKVDFGWSTLKYCENYKGDKFSKYNTQSKYGSVDNKTTLGRADDAATAKWDNGWCMPTIAQFQELEDKCTWTWTTINGKEGYEVKGPNGKTIFLPAAGYRSLSNFSGAGSYGRYWSSSLDTDYPSCGRYLGFDSGDVDPDNWYYRESGFSVRRCGVTKLTGNFKLSPPHNPPPSPPPPNHRQLPKPMPMLTSDFHLVLSGQIAMWAQRIPKTTAIILPGARLQQNPITTGQH